MYKIRLIELSLWFVIILAAIYSCDKLELSPKDVMTRESVFNNETGLKLYSNSFYDILPSPNEIREYDIMSDMIARQNVPNFIRPGAYSPRESSGWNWNDLRNINSFIMNVNHSTLDRETQKNYLGLARFFRAWFYFEKVIRFGDVPWISKPFDVGDEGLYNTRDERFAVMDSILTDINYAIDNINLENDESRTLITNDIALAFKSRMCLFEGSFRKYHPEFGYSNTADSWFEESASAAKKIIDSSKFTLHKGGNAYRELFNSKVPISDEIMLAKVFDTDLSVLHSMNWYWTSATYGVRGSFIRTFINTYLNIDGSRFTDDPNYKTMVFQDETKERDLRLQQTIRTKGFTRIQGDSEIKTPPQFSYTYTGYQPIKRVLDDYFYDGNAYNDNALVIFRFAEVLLNYAEAKAELNDLDVEDWNITIGALRERAGIINSGMPEDVDPYLQDNYFPELTDPTLLEIRRERGIELVLEGFRFRDLIRWKRGELLEMEWNGIYVPKINSYFDLNEDGDPDVYFYSGELNEDGIRGVSYIDISPVLDDGQTNPRILKEGDHGELIWLSNISREWKEKNYFYPIPESDIIINPALGQNPGW